MRTFLPAAGCAAAWLFIASCSGDLPSGAGGANASSGSSGTAATSTSSSTSSGSSSGAGGSSAAAIVDMFCHALTQPYCDADWTCCTSQWAGEHTGLTPEKCPAAFLGGDTSICDYPSNIDRPLLEASLEAGTTVFDQAQFDACLALLKSMTAGGSACVEPPRRIITTTCLRAFQGQIAPGGACTAFPGAHWSFYPCKSGRCEDGKCVPFLKTGDACDLNNTVYDPADTICNHINMETCRGAPDAGGGDAGVKGTCGPQGGVGDACDPGNDQECKSMKCDGVTGKCVLPDPMTTACWYY